MSTAIDAIEAAGFFLVLYVSIRFAVRDGIVDANRKRHTRVRIVESKISNSNVRKIR